MSTETAWQIDQTVSGETYTNYVRSDNLACSVEEDDDISVTAIFCEDTRSEWEKACDLAEFGSNVVTEIDIDKAVDAMNFDAISDQYDDGTAGQLERVGRNWGEASDIEKAAFVLLFEKLRRMANEAERLLETKYWGRL